MCIGIRHNSCKKENSCSGSQLYIKLTGTGVFVFKCMYQNQMPQSITASCTSRGIVTTASNVEITTV